MTRPYRFGASLSVLVVGLTATGAVIAVAVSSPSLFPARPAAALNVQIPLTSHRPVSYSTLLKLTGLSPDSLAAAGLSIEETVALAARAKAHLEESAPTIQEAVERHRDALVAVDRLEDLVRQGAAAETVQELHGARAAEEDARSAKELALAALYTAATNGLSDSSHDVLRTINSQRCFGLPLAMVASTRSEAEVVVLRDALADERIARKEGREASAEALAVIQRATDHRTLTAENNLRSLAAYRQAWRAALRE